MKRPKIEVIDHVDVAQADVRVLKNGVRLHVLQSSDEPVVRFSLVFRAGSAVQQVPFSASATANLLAEGTRRHTAQQIAEILDFHGSNYEVGIDRDWTTLNFVALSKHFQATLDLAREIVLEPLFSTEEVAIYREKHKQRLAIDRSRASMRARELFASALFGADHPYGVFYPESLYDNLTREDVVDFWQRRYTADNCFAVMSGNATETEIAGFAAMLGELANRGSVILSEAKDLEANRHEILRFAQDDATASLHTPHSTLHTLRTEQPGAVQSAIRMGIILFPRTHPDFAGMQVLATVLGGYFGSRLVRNLREERGYTYGVFSTMVALQNAGYLAIATEVGAEATDDAIVQIKHEIERLRVEPVPVEELEMVKNIMTGEVMRVLDGPFGIADVTIENACNGTDNTYNARWLAEVRAADPAHLQALAVKYLDPAAFTTVVVGPEK